MASYEIDAQWIDRYLRDQLGPEEEEAFEVELMDSPELQRELEAALGLREVLRADERSAPDAEEGPVDITGAPTAKWRNFAMAACLVLAVFSTTMYWRTSNELSNARNDLESLMQPVGDVLRVPVDIMRSGSQQEPDVIVQKPADDALLLLDIEVSPRARQEPALNLRLVSDDGTELMAWSSRPLPSGRHTAAIRSAQIPTSRIWLEASSLEGELLDRRLLEFR